LDRISFYIFHWLEICPIFTLNDRSDHKLWPKYKTSVNVSSALAGAAMPDLAFAEPFIASDAAAAFCFFSAEGKEKRIIRFNNLFSYLTIKISLDTTDAKHKKRF
jgi:hypothetical protein